MVSLHQVDVAMRYCPRVVALRQGKVVYDGPSAALTPGMLRDLYGTEADELLHDSVPDQADTTSAMPVPAMVTMNLAAA
ncbi:Hemin import ATP-binding protein HmuV [compost metagenome]